MKKIYNEPKEIVIELGLQGQLLDVSNSGAPETPLDGSQTDQGNGETMSARTQSVWGEW